MKVYVLLAWNRDDIMAEEAIVSVHAKHTEAVAIATKYCEDEVKWLHDFDDGTMYPDAWYEFYDDDNFNVYSSKKELEEAFMGYFIQEHTIQN